MNISPRVVSSTYGVTSTSDQRWVRVKGRPDGANVGRVVGERQIDNEVGHCFDIFFEATGELATYRSLDTETVPAPGLI
jgi:hypothetical protein